MALQIHLESFIAVGSGQFLSFPISRLCINLQQDHPSWVCFISYVLHDMRLFHLCTYAISLCYIILYCYWHIWYQFFGSDVYSSTFSSELQKNSVGNNNGIIFSILWPWKPIVPSVTVWQLNYITVWLMIYVPITLAIWNLESRWQDFINSIRNNSFGTQECNILMEYCTKKHINEVTNCQDVDMVALYWKSIHLCNILQLELIWI